MLKVGQIVKVNAQMVRVLSVDESDVACLVWGVSCADPDTSVWFYAADIEA